MTDVIASYSQFISFGLLSAGLWMSFRHQLGKPVSNKSSVAYLGDKGNPFALKEQYLRRYLTYPGIGLSLVGGILTILSAYFPKKDPLPNLCIGIFISLSVFILFGLVIQAITVKMARRVYYPLLLDHQRGLYKRDRFVLENDGLYEEDNSNLPRNVRDKRLESARSTLLKICEILEVDPSGDDDARLRKIKKEYGDP